MKEESQDKEIQEAELFQKLKQFYGETYTHERFKADFKKEKQDDRF